MLEADNIFALGLFKIFFALVGVFAWRLTLMKMDKYISNSESDFAQWLRNADEHTKSLYYAGRAIAVALVIAAAIS